MILAMASFLGRPSSGPELISLPSPGVATPLSAGSDWSVSTTTRTGSPNLRAKSRSRWSCAGTAMIAPVP